MEVIRLDSEIQENIQIQGIVSSFFDTFAIGKLLHRSGVRKRHGYRPRFLIEAIFRNIVSPNILTRKDVI